jgi:hypothetical protein
MEDLILKLLPSILEPLNKDQKNDEILLTLKKLFLIECRFNIKILATLRWENTSEKFKKEMIKHLQADAAKALFSFADKTFINYLFTKVKFKTNSVFHDEVKIVSIISKIEVLKVLSFLNEDLQKENKAVYKQRISNLEKMIVEIVLQLEKDIVK